MLGDTNSTDALKYYEDAIRLSIEMKEAQSSRRNMSLHLLRNRNFEKDGIVGNRDYPIVGTMGRNLPARIKALDRADGEEKRLILINGQ